MSDGHLQGQLYLSNLTAKRELIRGQTIVLKQEKLEAVSEIFARLVQVTDSLDLCNVSIPSSPDKVRLQLAKVYIAILELVVLVTEYCAIGRTCKFLSK